MDDIVLSKAYFAKPGVHSWVAIVYRCVLLFSVEATG